jgi:lysophospholipase L1-like esterase
MRARLPDTRLVYVSIKPSIARERLLPQIRAANDLVRDYAATQQHVAYLDVFTPMLGKDGQPQAKWFIQDGLHMNRAGYALWARIVRPWVDAHGR